MEGASYHNSAFNEPLNNVITSKETETEPTSNVSILYGVLPKIDLLRAEAAAANYPSVICIVESWLSEEILDDEISINGYHIIRLDRNRQGAVYLFIFTIYSRGKFCLRVPMN